MRPVDQGREVTFDRPLRPLLKDRARAIRSRCETSVRPTEPRRAIRRPLPRARDVGAEPKPPVGAEPEFLNLGLALKLYRAASGNRPFSC